MSHNTLAIRVDGSQHFTPLQDFLRGDGGAFLVVTETVEGANPHAHAVMHTSRKTPAFRMALKRALLLEGNGAYSVAEVRDLAKYHRYMLKGDAAALMPVIAAAYGMEYANPDWQKAQHDAYWVENAANQRKRAAEPVPVAVLHACREQGICWDRRELIARLYIKELVDRSKAINLFSLKSNINLIQCQLCPGEEAVEDLARQV